MDMSTRLSLKTTCTGPGCNMAAYQWHLQGVSSSGYSVYPMNLSRDMTETDLNLPGIVLKGNHLPRYMMYRLMVTVTPDNGPAGRAAYQFKANGPPQSGGCYVSRYSGDALKTKFYFTCSGWIVRFLVEFTVNLFSSVHVTVFVDILIMKIAISFQTVGFLQQRQA